MYLCAVQSNPWVLSNFLLTIDDFDLYCVDTFVLEEYDYDPKSERTFLWAKTKQKQYLKAHGGPTRKVRSPRKRRIGFALRINFFG